MKASHSHTRIYRSLFVFDVCVLAFVFVARTAIHQFHSIRNLIIINQLKCEMLQVEFDRDVSPFWYYFHMMFLGRRYFFKFGTPLSCTQNLSHHPGGSFL